VGAVPSLSLQSFEDAERQRWAGRLIYVGVARAESLVHLLYGFDESQFVTARSKEHCPILMCFRHPPASDAHLLAKCNRSPLEPGARPDPYQLKATYQLNSN
jgi:hypothetical protein